MKVKSTPSTTSHHLPHFLLLLALTLANNHNVTITLCSLDGRTGKCVSQTYYVQSP